MLSAPTGLNKASAQLKIGAALLLIISLWATSIQAAPVPAYYTTSTVAIRTSDPTVQQNVPRDLGGCVRPDRSPSTSVVGLKHCNELLGNRAPIQPMYARGLASGKKDTIVLARRGLGAKIRAAFHHLGEKIKHGFQKLGHAIKTGFQKFGHAIKTAAQKVGHFIKTTGAKIAKVALKIVSTVGKIASKVIGFIPGVGKVVGKAIEGVSEGLNKASDAIHAHIGGKLGQAMDRMSKAQHIVGKIP